MNPRCWGNVAKPWFQQISKKLKKIQSTVDALFTQLTGSGHITERWLTEQPYVENRWLRRDLKPSLHRRLDAIWPTFMACSSWEVTKTLIFDFTRRGLWFDYPPPGGFYSWRQSPRRKFRSFSKRNFWTPLLSSWTFPLVFQKRRYNQGGGHGILGITGNNQVITRCNEYNPYFSPVRWCCKLSPWKRKGQCKAVCWQNMWQRLAC